MGRAGLQRLQCLALSGAARVLHSRNGKFPGRDIAADRYRGMVCDRVGQFPDRQTRWPLHQPLGARTESLFTGPAETHSLCSADPDRRCQPRAVGDRQSLPAILATGVFGGGHSRLRAVKSVSRLQDPPARATGRHRIRRADQTRGGDPPHCHCDHRRTHVGGSSRV